MANFVADDKGSDEDGYSYYTSITNGNEYKYEKAVAEAVFAKYGFDKEDSLSMLEMTAVEFNTVAEKEGKSFEMTIPKGTKAGNKITINLPNGKTVNITVPRGMKPGNTITINYLLDNDFMLSEAELTAGANGLTKWKEAEAAAAEAERVRKAEEAAAAKAAYEAALAAAAAAEEAERAARLAKEAEEKQAADEAAAKKAAEAKPKSMFGRMSKMANQAAEVATKAFVVGLAAAEAGWNTARAANEQRKAELKEAKAKNEAAEAAATEPLVPAKKLTFFEKMQRDAGNLGSDANKGLRAVDSTVKEAYSGEQKKQ